MPQDTGGVVNTENFDIVTYSGNGTTQSISSLDFSPDFIWFKSKTAARSNAVVDSVRGNRNIHWTDLTSQAYDSDVGDDLVSFDSNGFSIGPVDNAGSINTLNDDIVAWCWKAGGAAASNTDGLITSSVSANTAAGFSIVKWEGNSTAPNVGHGLSQEPELLIIKSISNTANWFVHSDGMSGTGYYMFLDSNNSEVNTLSFVTSKNSSTFTLGGAFAYGSGNHNIAYCFHSVDGYQKISTYTGNGTSGNTVTLGFEPKFVIIKNRTSTNSNWMIYDSVRDSDGTMNKYLEANTNDIEASAATASLAVNSNGFTIGNTSSVHLNKQNDVYIYLAIA